MARVSKLRRPVAICRRGNILNGEVFSYDKNRHLPQKCNKKNALMEKFKRSPRKTGRRRSTEWFEGDFKDMPEAEFVAWNKALKS